MKKRLNRLLVTGLSSALIIVALCGAGNPTGWFSTELLNDNASEPFIDLFGEGGGFDPTAKPSDTETEDSYAEEIDDTTDNSENENITPTDNGNLENKDADSPDNNADSEEQQFIDSDLIEIVVEWDTYYFKDHPDVEVDDFLEGIEDTEKQITIIDDYAEASTYRIVCKRLHDLGFTNIFEETD